MYKLIGGNDLLNPIEQILKNRGITRELLEVGEEVVEDYMNYDNIIEGCELLMKHIDEGNRIGVLIDTDVDGLTSSGMLINYLRREFKDINIVTYTHLGKQHGINDKNLNIKDIDLLIVPDAGTNDGKQIEELYARGIEVLVIDHHELDVEYPKCGILINNQTSKRVKNKQFSGVGVVYKFLCAFSDYYFLESPDEYLDILSLGLLSDVMSMTSPETRYYTKKGMENINNKFFKALIEEKKYDLDGKINMNSLSWNVSPVCNGCIRGGTLKEKEDLYSAFFNDDYEDCLRIAKGCKNAKTRQDSAVKKNVAKIEGCLDIKDEDKIIIIDSNGANKSQTGLIAGKLASKYALPVILYSSDNGVARGSIRGLGDIDLKEDLIKSGLVDFCQGHSLAAGIGLKVDNIHKLKEYINELYKDVDFGSKEYEVDFEIEEWEVNQEFVDEVASFEDEVGNGIEFPLIAIKDCCVYLTGDNIKGRLNVVWDINGVKVIKKFTSNVWKEQYIGTEFYCDIIGKCVVDSFSGKGCIEIVDLAKN